MKLAANRTRGTYTIPELATAWPKNNLHEAGEAPSVTEILGRTEKAEGLIRWAASAEGKAWEAAVAEYLGHPDSEFPTMADRLNFIKSLVGPKRAHEKISDKAKDIGSMVHRMIEQELLGYEEAVTSDDPEAYGLACMARDAWLRWAERQDFELVESEETVARAEIRAAGTLDLLARLNGRLTVLDWKSSAAIYPSHLVQSAAYRIIHPRYGEIEAIGVLRLPKAAKDYKALERKFGVPFEYIGTSDPVRMGRLEVAFVRALEHYRMLKERDALVEAIMLEARAAATPS